jgi:hypothetical protein
MTAALRHFVVVRPTKAVFAPATLLRTVVGSDVLRPASTCAAPHVPRRAQRPRAPRPAPRRAQRPRSSVAELLLALYAAFATCCVVSDTTPWRAQQAVRPRGRPLMRARRGTPRPTPPPGPGAFVLLFSASSLKHRSCPVAARPACAPSPSRPAARANAARAPAQYPPRAAKTRTRLHNSPSHRLTAAAPPLMRQWPWARSASATG